MFGRCFRRPVDRPGGGDLDVGPGRERERCVHLFDFLVDRRAAVGEIGRAIGCGVAAPWRRRAWRAGMQRKSICHEHEEKCMCRRVP